MSNEFSGTTITLKNAGTQTFPLTQRLNRHDSTTIRISFSFENILDVVSAFASIENMNESSCSEIWSTVVAAARSRLASKTFLSQTGRRPHDQINRVGQTGYTENRKLWVCCLLLKLLLLWLEKIDIGWRRFVGFPFVWISEIV